MPLQNRMQPDGDIVANSSRGTLFGNRGGRIHDADTKTLHPTKRWASRQWICCVLDFKNRQRELMSSNSYTELFFLDEVTALAAGHRPCFECRRNAAVAYGEAWKLGVGLEKRPSAPEMDRILHDQRLENRKPKTHQREWRALPDGAMIFTHDDWIAKFQGKALLWSFEGYLKAPQAFAPQPQSLVDCLTPPATLTALENGYQPLWHPSVYLV
jgi:hypothetical protein